MIFTNRAVHLYNCDPSLALIEQRMFKPVFTVRSRRSFLAPYVLRIVNRRLRFRQRTRAYYTIFNMHHTRRRLNVRHRLFRCSQNIREELDAKKN